MEAAVSTIRGMGEMVDETTGLRGPAEHRVRDQIVEAANEHFSRYGYAKTTLSDLARVIGFSKAYIYRFFESKQAIGEVICKRALDSILAEIEPSVSQGRCGSDKIRRLFRTTVETSANLFFQERKLYDISAASFAESWRSSQAFSEELRTRLAAIITEGRSNGEFDRKTALDETCDAILLAMQPFIDPRMLQHNLDRVPDGLNAVISLILRSLAV